MSIDHIKQKVIKCDLCHGTPTCVDFCEAGALKYVEQETATLPKKRASAARFSALMGASH
jgi:Fe-S-cluster-containing hydrogenase component 2